MAAATHYVTVAGAGTKAGGDWDNAMDFAAWFTDLGEASEAGDKYYLEEGTYTFAAGLRADDRDGTDVLPIWIIGVKSGTTAEPPTTTDYAYTTARPVIAVAANLCYLGADCKLLNLSFTTAGATGINVGGGSELTNCKVYNSSASADRDGFQDNSYCRYISCDIRSTNGYGIDLYQISTVFGCFIHDSKIGVGSGSAGNIIVNNVFDTCSTAGVSATNNSGWAVIGNTFYTCGIGISGTTAGKLCAVNNILDACTTGASWTTQTDVNSWDYNCWDSTTDATNVVQGEHKVEGDPLLEAPATNDFTLGSGSPAIDTGLDATEAGVTV